MCPVTMLALQEGQALDPNVLVPMRVIGHWASRVWEGALPQDRIQAKWDGEGGQDLVNKSKRIGAVRGPMGAFLHHATQIGWGGIGHVEGPGQGGPGNGPSGG